MGSVYLARDLDLDREVAIKFISAERSGDAVAQRRLIHEARAAAALDHPNICAVHDIIIEPDGRACIVMQLVEGETLSSRLRRGPLEPRQALLMAADVASALAAAHKRGIIHRDIKPQNIMLTPSGKAKLLDFGIARLDEGPHTGAGDTTTTRLTRPGHLAGTPAYMSPEQVQRLPLDGRSDLFALGAVLYECVTGRRPFDAPTDAEIYVQILHDHPPAVSTLRPQLTDREDELCRRLLAKHPDDRFISAEELLGALRVLAPDTAHASGTNPRGTAGQTPHAPHVGTLAVLALIIVGAVGTWLWLRPGPLPPAPPGAERWYLIGIEAIRDGAYHSAQLALQQAIDAFPEYALAYARIAEAHSELDDSERAKTALLMVDSLVDNPARLEVDDRLRLDAVRALVVRDVAAAVKSYKALADRRPSDAGVWLDLGRAQEAAAVPADARASYERAIGADRDYAPAHLRRAVILTQQGQQDEAFREFDEAERLYRAASNGEGQTETLLRRGSYQVAIGQLGAARETVERARVLAAGLDNRSQEIRARLRLSSVTAWQGEFGAAERLASAAVDAALHHGLDSVAADGLIELGTTLTLMRNYVHADAQLLRAIQLAEKRGAHRLLARARLQRASMLVVTNRPGEALAAAESSVRFMREHGYRRSELQGLSIMTRARLQLEQFEEARPMANEGLRVAEELKDNTQIADALENLATLSAGVGALPEALAFRERQEAIHRAQKSRALSFDLTNRAEILMRLGRRDEADRALDEVDAGVAQGVEAFKGRARRVAVLRGLAATIARQYEAVVRLAGPVVEASSSPRDSTALLGAALLAHAEAQLGRRSAPPEPPPAADQARELLYWELAKARAAGDAKAVVERAAAELGRPMASYELEWRVAALGAAAATRARMDDKAAELSGRASVALQRLRDEWKENAARYESRPDVAELLRDAGLKRR
jgi:tetratricopeptide (TPR) repeat protein